MEALNQWVLAQSNLKRAASDFLDACTTLKAVALQPLASRYSRDTLETALNQVQSHMNSVTLVEDQLKESRTALNALFNASTIRVLINKLPSELLSDIFAIVLNPPICHIDSLTPCEYLTDIRLVCQRWNRIITATPLFWSHIDVDLDIWPETPGITPTFYFARMRLERSRGVPVHFHLASASKVPPDGVSELVSVLRPHLTRLNALTISRARTSRLVQALLELYSSLGRPGTLKSLSLEDIHERHEDLSISWPIPSLSGLVELDLYDLRKYASPLTGDLVALLSNCPTLHTLRLRFLGVRASPVQEYPAIRLPCLRLLELGIHNHREEILQLLPLLSPGVHELDVRLSLPSIGLSSLVPHIQLLLERSNVTFLTFQGTPSGYIAEYKSLLSSTPRLRALLLHYTTSDNLGIIEELLAPTKENSSRPLPHLQCLCLISGEINLVAVGYIERVIAARNLRSLVFWSCIFSSTDASNSDEGEDEDEDEADVPWSQGLTEDMTERLSGRVERIVVNPLPRTRVHHGVDLSVQGLIISD